MPELSPQAAKAFLLHGTRTGKLAVVRKDGRPQVTPVWFLLDESGGELDVVFTTWGASVKAAALRRDPRFSLCVDDEAPPYGYVTLHCTARITEEPEVLLEWATRLGRRYMGADQQEAYGKRNSVPGELLVRGTVDKIISQTGVADWP